MPPRRQSSDEPSQDPNDSPSKKWLVRNLTRRKGTAYIGGQYVEIPPGQYKIFDERSTSLSSELEQVEV